jgi:hypothetical protein
MLPTQGCLTVKIHRPLKSSTAKAKRAPMMATKEELEARIVSLSKQIDSFIVTVDLTPSTGSVYKGEITEYRDIRGYILFRRPEDIRIVGQYPVVRSTLFDMASTGKEFRAYVASKNRFVVGENAAPLASANKLENLRPEIFLQSMLIRPLDPATERTLLFDFSDEDNSFYILMFFGNDAKNGPVPLRSVWFDRLDLRILRQVTYSPNSNTLSDTRYSEWTDYSGVSFPKKIDINRPTDGFGVVLDIVDMKMNTAITDQQFVLSQPPGTTLQVIGNPKDVPPQPAPTPQKNQK